MEEIRNRLLKALEMRDMTASELAKKSGIGKGSISKYLKGTVIPKQNAIGSLSEALGVSPAWLLGYDLTIDGKKKYDLDVGKLTEVNQEKLLAYYQALLDTQGE